jgi:hypothetical protein
MKGRGWCLRGFISVFVFALLATFSSFALAETDVTTKVQLIKSALTYDTRTATSALNVSLKNISQECLRRVPPEGSTFPDRHASRSKWLPAVTRIPAASLVCRKFILDFITIKS